MKLNKLLNSTYFDLHFRGRAAGVYRYDDW